MMSAMAVGASRRGPFATSWVWAVAAVQLALLVATSSRYGYHRDELYFIVAGGHAAFGYPDQPPLVPLLAWTMNALAPGSLLVLRLPSALVASATTLIAALIAREVGGDGRAQLIAAGCTAVSGFALAISHLVSTTTPDMLDTTLLGWLAIRIVLRGSQPALLLAGLVVGLGIEAKPQVGLVALVMALVLIVTGPREPLRTWWAAAGAALAIVLAAPYLIWQAAHGWPQLTVAHNIAGSQEGGRAGFIPFQLVMVSPVLVPVWIAGLRAPFRRPGLERLRFIPITYAAMGVLYLVGNGHAYYLASLYPLLLGLGAVPTADWIGRGRRRRGLLLAGIVLSGAFSSLIALPLLPVRDLQGSIVMAINPAQGDTVGWPSFVGTVRRAWLAIPAAERAHTAIFTANYGEAGAIDLLGSRLPRAYSGHNGFTEWGEPPDSDTSAMLTGFGAPDQVGPAFERCRTLAVVNNGVGLNNQEQNDPVMLCRLRLSWRQAWPSLRHYD
jgi:4-amino-4-deoxy-L-arabinose transferase-like glycosyltransferase